MENQFLKIGAEKNLWNFNSEKNSIEYFLKNGRKFSRKLNPEEVVRAKFFLELVEKYQYSPENIDFEIRVNLGSAGKKSPDLVIFEKNSEKVFAAIEFKKSEISDAEFEAAIFQGESYAKILNAKFFGAVAGIQFRFFETKNFDRKNPDKNTIAALPQKYGKPELLRFKKGDEKWDLSPVSPEELKSVLKKCHQTLWSGGKRDSILAFGEMAKLIFVKIWDEKNTKRNNFYEFQRKTNESPIEVKKRIDQIYKNAKNDDPEVFDDKIEIDAGEIATLVEYLQKFSFLKTDVDIKGLGFQQFVGNFFKGEYGAFFTPPPMVKFCVAAFSESLKNTHKIIDPACGSGGFLLEALNEIRRKADKKFGENPTDPFEIAQKFEFWNSFAKSNLFGIEISHSISKLAKMNMLLHEDGRTNVIRADGLGDFEKFQKKNLQFKKNNFDFIFTNPPFGATVKGTEKNYLKNYELGQNKNKPRANQKTEILFIERCRDFLKSDGKMAIVLPDGILTNSSLQYVRDFILENFQILGVVSLPSDAFRHFGAGVKSSILFLRKLKPDEKVPPETKIFMAAPEKIGIDATGRKCRNDLDEIAKQFHEFLKKRNDFFFENLNSDLVFGIELMDLKNGRFDPYFFNSQFQEIFENEKKCPFEIKKVSEISEKIFSGITPLSGGDSYISKNDGIPFVRSGNISENCKINLDDLIFIKKEIHEKKMKSSQLKKNDILIAIVGATIGMVSQFKENYPANINQAIAGIRFEKEKVLPDFVRLFFQTKWGQLQIEQLKRPVARANINLEEIGTLKIPLLPLSMQKKLAEKMDAAFLQKKENEKKADELLNSIDDFLLENLGIEKPEKEKSKMIFSISHGDLRTKKNRFDPFFWSPKTTEIKNVLKNQKFETAPLRDFVKNTNSGEWGKDLNFDDENFQKISVLRNTNFENKFNLNLKNVAERKLDPKKIEKTLLHENDILIEKSGGSPDQPVGRVAIIEKENAGKFGFSNFLQKIEIQNIFPKFLFEVLKTFWSSGFTEHLQNQTTGIRNLKIPEYLNLPIPVAPLEIQKKLIAEISARREKAKKLRVEAAEILENAKMNFENEISKTPQI